MLIGKAVANPGGKLPLAPTPRLFGTVITRQRLCERHLYVTVGLAHPESRSGRANQDAANGFPTARQATEFNIHKKSPTVLRLTDLGVTNESPKTRRAAELGVTDELPRRRRATELGVSKESPKMRRATELGVANESSKTRRATELGVSNESPKPMFAAAFVAITP